MKIRAPASADVPLLHCLRIEPPEVRTAAKLSTAQQQRLSAALFKNLNEVFKDRLAVGPEDQGGCARLRTAITAVSKSNVIENVVFGVAVLPVIPSNGALAIQGEALSPDGRPLAAIVWAKTGSPFSLLSGLKETGQAEALTKDFSRRFRTLLSPTPPG